MLARNVTFSLFSSFFLFLGALHLLYSTTSPRHIYQNKRRNLICLFKGWPLPRVAWYKDGQPINGSEGGFYYTQRPSEIYPETFHYILHIPPGREEYEGHYSCIAENSFNGWSSKQSSMIQVIYACK